jgi:hypothetical protein
MLRSRVPKPDGTRHPVCDYDFDNLKWSRKAILSSITLALWETAKKDLGVDASGPEAFASVISKLQQVNLAAIRSLVNNELKSLSLIKEPGQDMEIFGGRVIELCRHIWSGGICSKRCDQGRGSMSPTVRHPRGLEDFLNKPLLGEFE